MTVSDLGLDAAEYPAPPARVFSLSLVRVTGLFVFSFQSVQTVAGSLEDCEAHYRSIRTFNLLFGWWSFVGWLWNPAALSRNKKALKELRVLANGPAPADWHEDPTGRHALRYWDGERWTDHVSDQASDAL
jgi:Protein of unknown function (DUF2510).